MRCLDYSQSSGLLLPMPAFSLPKKSGSRVYAHKLLQIEAHPKGARELSDIMGCCAQRGARDHVIPAETVRDSMEQLTRSKEMLRR